MTGSKRENAYFRLLVAAILTSWVTALCFTLEFYPGAPFGPDWRMARELEVLAIGGLFLVLPAALFALFAVWPLALFVTQLVYRVEKNISPRWNWPLWIGTGAIIGPLALFAYSFPLGLGQALIANLLVTGIACGALCATMVRWLIGPEINDCPTPFETETTHHLA